MPAGDLLLANPYPVLSSGVISSGYSVSNTSPVWQATTWRSARPESIGSCG